MGLVPDVTRPGPKRGRPRTPFRTRYHLALYGQLGEKRRSVLVVSMWLQFRFVPGSQWEGEVVHWQKGERETFARNSILAIKQVWDDKFRIVTTSTVPEPAFRNVGVVFSISARIDGLSFTEDYELTVRRILAGRYATSSYDDRRGEATLDSEDLRPNPLLPMPQRGVVHEFGHMLGLKDEYPGAATCNGHWVKDIPSIMHSGELVRPRHYVPFATWLTRKFEREARRRGEQINYQVDGLSDGLWDESNAGL